MKKKFLSLFMVIAITIFQFAPTMVSALSYELNDGDIINSYNVTSDVVTLYVGNISVDGTSTLKYLYTDKSVNTETLTEMRKILTSDYASLLPTTAGQVAVSNDSSVTVNDVFTDAGMVAINKYPSGTVSDTSSTILYNQTQINSLATASQAEISDEATAETNNLSAWNTRKTEWDAVQQAKADEDPSYTPVSFPEEYVKAFNDSTSYPTTPYFIADNKGTEFRGYIIRNGVVAQVNTYPLNRTIIKVVNTSANVTTTSSSKTPITSAEVTLTAPKVGDKVEKITKNDGYGDYDAQSLNPTVTTTTEGISVYAYWVSGLEDLSEEPFYGTFEEDKYYYAMIDFEAKEGYELPATFPDGIKVNGVAPDEIFAVYGGTYTHCVVKIKATTTVETSTYEYVDNTANQTYTINKDDTLTVRINADYSLFENGGKVYVDGALVDSKKYTSKSGSTIITFTKDYMNSLSAGNHTLKVVFNNGGTAETTFTIANANTTSNPQTGDNVMFYISMLGLSIIGLAGVGIYTKKKRFN